MDQLEEINDESNHELDSPRGYYTRAKRRKLSEKYQEKEEASTSGLYRVPKVGKRKNPIMFVPTEVLQCIFKHISYHELSTTIRLVNRRFRTVAEDLLNIGFKKIGKRLDGLIAMIGPFDDIKDDMEMKCICKLLNLVEILELKYDIVIATIWRYVYNELNRRACMYGGLLIDTYESFIGKFLHCPNQLYGPAVVRDYALPQEVTKIIQMTDAFCIHFDKTNEETMSNSCALSGCKLLDILDCSKYCKRAVDFEINDSEIFEASYYYFFKNSWFIAMPIPSNKEMDWPQQQQMMHMRLRRIVLAHNDMYLQQEQYQEEVILRPNARLNIRRPGNNVYTGYDDVEDTFFYYGVMNDGAAFYKFHPIIEDNDEQDDEEDANEPVHPVEDNDEQDDEEDANEPVHPVEDNDEQDYEEDANEPYIYGTYKSPYLGFDINVTVRCPTKFAPLKFLKSLPFQERMKLLKKNHYIGETKIRMEFYCYGAHYARLPPMYRYHMVRRGS